jgi:hypothetical protein
MVEFPDGELLMILRSGGPRHYEARSRDGGHTWSKPVMSALVGANTPTALWANRKQPEEVVAVWNSNPLHRWPLVAALSRDRGRTWSSPRVLANPGRQVSYPGLTQLAAGEMVAVWEEDDGKGGISATASSAGSGWWRENDHECESGSDWVAAGGAGDAGAVS